MSPPAVRFRVIQRLAHGGMAEVFLAHQLGAEGFRKPVVLKRILPALAADPAFVRMLVDEAHVASAMNHSNLVQVLDLRRSRDGEYFLVLEYVDGWSLEQLRRRARRGRLPLPLALHVTAALCRGLAYVHDHAPGGRPLAIVHRDVSPQNVLVSRAGEVKLADFGIALAAGRREKSATGVIKGKFAYMSPEQASGAELDARSDLFAVGTLLYVLTTGQKPFAGKADADVVMAVRRGRYAKPSTIVRGFDEAVERAIARALRVDRSKRWQSAEQLANRLDALLLQQGQAGSRAALVRWIDALPAAAEVAPPDAAPPPPATATVDLGTADLELEDLPGGERPAASAGDPATRAGKRRPPSARAPSPRDDDSATWAAPPRTLVEIAPGRVVARPEPAVPAPGRLARARRTLVRAALATTLLALVLATAGWFARPYLPAALVAPVDRWLRTLPAPLDRLADPPPGQNL